MTDDENVANETHQEMAEKAFALLMEYSERMTFDEAVAVIAHTLGYYVLAGAGGDTSTIRRESLNQHVLVNMNARIDDPDPEFGKPDTPLN